MTGEILISLLKALLITEFTEGLVLLCLYPTYKNTPQKSYLFIALLLGNLLTNPFINMGRMVLSGTGFASTGPIVTVFTVFGEVAAVFAEGFIYSYLGEIKPARALLISLILNAASLLAGFIIL